MLASLAIVLRPLEPVRPMPLGVGHAIRGWFYDSVTEAAPEVAQAIHDAEGIKPFTVSLLLGPGRRENGRLHLKPLSYTVRVTALDEAVYESIRKACFEQMRGEVVFRIRAARFAIEAVQFRGATERYAAQSSFAALWQTEPRRVYDFQFITPTSFRMGQSHLPLPIPASIYRGLWLKWNAFAPAELAIGDEVLGTVAEHLFPTTHRIQTRVVEGAGYQFLGFVGRCCFAVSGKVAGDHLRALTALSEFAFYAGVGSKTTEGMGQVLVLREGSGRS